MGARRSHKVTMYAPVALVVVWHLLVDVALGSPLPLCNPSSISARLVHHSTKVSTISNQLPERVLDTAIFSPHPVETRAFEPFHRHESQLLFAKSAVYFADAADRNGTFQHASPHQTRVFAINMEQQASELFDQTHETGTPFCVNDMNVEPDYPGFTDASCYIFRLYQKQYPEHLRLVSFNSENPRDMVASSNSRYVAWIEDSPGGPANRTVIVIYDMQYHGIVQFPFNKIQEHFQTNQFSLSHPSFCGSTLVFQVDVLGNSHVCLFSIPEQTFEVVGSSVTHTSFHPTGSAWSCEDDADPGSCECYVAWVSTPRDSVPTLLRNDTVVSLFRYPSRTLHRLVAADWAPGEPSFESLSYVFDMTITSNSLYVVVSSLDESLFLIKQASLSDMSPVFQDIEGSISDTPIMIHTTHGDTVLYWQQGVDPGADELRLLSYRKVADFEGSQRVDFAHCVVNSAADTAAITDLTYFQDVLITAKRIGNGTTTRLELMDFDKDHDHVLDVNDRFPVHHWYIWDSDNDGYADARDFIHGGFGDDDVVMYCMWIVFVCVIMILIVLYHFVGKYLRNMQMTEKASLPSTPSGGSKKQPNILKKTSSNWIGFTPGDEKAERSSTTMAERILRQMDKTHTPMEVFLTVLTVGSMVLAIFPSYPYQGVLPKTYALCLWCDFFITTIFIVDVGIRCVFRDRKELPTISSFVLANMYDIPALLTDVPMTGMQMPELLGLLKGFRVVRLYRRFTQQTIFISIIVKQPFVYLTVFVLAGIVICAVCLKMLEQAETPEFREFDNALWFAIGTVTTVGYGDLNVKTAFGRILMVILMLTGISLISTLSAFTVAKIVAIGKTEHKKAQVKDALRAKWELMKVGLVHIAEPYNPIAHTVNEIWLANNGRRRPNPIATSSEPKHKSSTLNVMVGMNTEIELPVDKIMKGAGGKFTVNSISSQAELIRSIFKEHEQKMLLEVVKSQGKSRKGDHDFTPRTRIHFLLRRFRLHKSIQNFLEFAEELADIILEPPRPNGQFMMKIFSTRNEAKKRKQLGVNLDFMDFEYRDPLDVKLVYIDEHFERYGVHHRIDYNEVMTEITKIVVMIDRVEAVKWCIEHLEYKPTIEPPMPLLQEVVPPMANMPVHEVMFVDETIMMELIAKPNEEDRKLGREVTIVRAGFRRRSLSGG